jgi:hypothetical protein
MVKKILGWAAIAFVVFYIVRNPANAAATVKSVGVGIANLATRFGDFFSNLAK